MIGGIKMKLLIDTSITKYRRETVPANLAGNVNHM
jgi:hypothetical protein